MADRVRKGAPVPAGVGVCIRWIGFAALVVLLNACGFHLRNYSFSASVDSYALAGNTRLSVAAPIRQNLKQAGVEETSRGDAALVLELLDQRRDRRSISTAGGARAAEYETSYAVQYRILSGSGEELVPPTWIERQRVYRIDSSNIVGSSQEQTLLQRELMQDVAGQIIRAMDTVSRGLHGVAGAEA